jgi:hypothetical protein
MLGLFGRCTIKPHSLDMTREVQSTNIRSDHDSLAGYYEDAAKEMKATAIEHKKCLPNTSAGGEIKLRLDDRYASCPSL